MTRFILLTALAALPHLAHAQISQEQGMPHYDTTFTAKGSKNELFFKAKAALLGMDGSSNNIEDKELGLLSTRVGGSMHHKAGAKQDALYYSYTIIIKTDDNKASIMFTSYSSKDFGKLAQRKEEDDPSAYDIPGFDAHNRHTMNSIIRVLQ